MKWVFLSPHAQAWALRRRADRLCWLAETIATAEPCRDMRAEVDRLRERAGHAEQRAEIAEGVIGRLGEADSRFVPVVHRMG
jgi:hypothetical protein